jgi:predicted dehydrogenase
VSGAKRPVAIVGTGFMGRVHARAAEVAGGRVVGVVGSSPDKAAAAREELRADRAFASLDELIATVDVDVVHICTPNHLHADATFAALAAGKHVVCEKPLSIDGETAGAMSQAAAASRTTPSSGGTAPAARCNRPVVTGTCTKPIIEIGYNVVPDIKIQRYRCT